MSLSNMFKPKYPLNTDCNNCNHKITIQVPKGMTKEEALERAHCPECGCLIRGGKE